MGKARRSEREPLRGGKQNVILGMNKPEKKNKSVTMFTVAVKQKKMKTHGNDPFFVASAEASKSIIEKYGFPKKLVSKKNKGTE